MEGRVIVQISASVVVLLVQIVYNAFTSKQFRIRFRNFKSNLEKNTTVKQRKI